VTISVFYRFDDAVVLITGAGSGIGAALARHCAREGARVIAVDRRHEALLGGLDERTRRMIDVRQVDVANEPQISALVEDVKHSYPRLDAAVLGAAIQYRTDIDRMTVSQWDEVVEINLNGVFYCLKGLVPLLKSQRQGAIVAFTSGLAHSGWAGASAYAATKAAIIGLIKSVALELKDFNVRANVLSPGLRATPIFLDVSDAGERNFYDRTIGIGKPEGVVPTLLYLISNASANLTGAVIEHRITLPSERVTLS
jgi:3-oxoacyl-[acyl-carrier protein] reductase